MAEVTIEQLLDAVQALLGRIDRVEFTNGPPSPLVGAVGTTALAVGDELRFYGPKTTDPVDPWGPGILMSGVPGPAGIISGATIVMLTPGAEPTVTLGGTPSDRTLALGLPAAADGMTPNVSFEIVMVAHGEPATVVQSGTVEAPHLIFNIPSPLPGVDGKNVEIQKSATHIQWRRVGDVAWVDLIALTDLMVKGDKGDAFEFDAKPADMAARAAYDTEPEGFTVLVMDTGYVYARIASTPGVWSDGFPFGQTQNAILEALSALNATEGVLVQTGAATFAKRAIGATSDDDLLNRGAADLRYRLKGEPVALADVTGLAAALDDKANAAAVIALLAQKADKADTYTKVQVDGLIPVFATVAEVRAGNVASKAVDPSTLADADGYIPITANGAFTLDFSTGRKFKVTLTANSTMSITGLTKEISGVIRFQQDATGSRTLAVNAAIKKVGSYTLSTAANAVDRCGVEICGGVVELTALEKGIA
ncbi:hypothetical protein [Brevundimonas sp.]|uniref:hypothetical protein n=1 Tax=Brevundimonas sp. TaxID=1871086 RepID=UPI0028A1B649|nr:hypothetical protein [Brevundimonas sp.]